jgi:hypothetical protein
MSNTQEQDSEWEIVGNLGTPEPVPVYTQFPEQEDGGTWSDLFDQLKGKVEGKTGIELLKIIEHISKKDNARFIAHKGRNPNAMYDYWTPAGFVNETNVFGETLLHAAANNPNVDKETLKILLRIPGIDIEQRDSRKNETPLEAAQRLKNYTLINFLTYNPGSIRGLIELSHKKKLSPDITGKMVGYINPMGRDANMRTYSAAQPSFKEKLKKQKEEEEKEEQEEEKEEEEEKEKEENEEEEEGKKKNKGGRKTKKVKRIRRRVTRRKLHKKY